MSIAVRSKFTKITVATYRDIYVLAYLDGDIFLLAAIENQTLPKSEDLEPENLKSGWKL